MSFTQENFMSGRGEFNGSATPSCFAIHRYVSKTDKFLDIEADPDYFPDYFGLDSNSIKDKDYVYVQDINAAFKQFLVNLDEFGGISLVATTDNIVLPATIHGLDPTLTFNIDLRLYLRENQVHLGIPVFSLPSPNVSDFCTLIGLSTIWAPATQIDYVDKYMFITNNNINTFGIFEVAPTGLITIGPSDATAAGFPIQKFTPSAPMGWRYALHTWPINII